MPSRAEAMRFVEEVLGRAGRMNALKAVSLLVSEFGFRKETAIDILKSLERIGKVRLQGNDLVLAKAEPALASPKGVTNVTPEDGLEAALLEYLDRRMAEGGEAMEHEAEDVALAKGKYLVAWDVDGESCSSSDRVRRYRRLQKVLSELAKKGVGYEWVNRSVVLVDGEMAAYSIAGVFEGAGRVRVFRVLPSPRG
ncbi:MAG: hypothetical protein QW692_03545 [Nitrososphaerota archaeon]